MGEEWIEKEASERDGKRGIYREMGREGKRQRERERGRGRDGTWWIT